MNGEAPLTLILGGILLGILLLVGYVISGYVADVTPHDKPYYNETLCSGVCTPATTTFTFLHGPVLNSTVTCTNGTSASLTKGCNGACVCGGYNVLADLRTINLTNSTSGGPCTYKNVICDYTYDWADNGQQSYWTTAFSNISSAFTLATIMVIIMAAVAIVSYIVLMRG